MKDFLDSLTLADVEFYETEVQEPIGEVYDKGFIAKSTIVLYYLFKRRSNPEFTLDDARATTPVAAMAEMETYTPKVTEQA
jgi:hypothetical protein